MSDSFEMRVIARIHSDFGSKFGVPRQSGLVDALEAAVVFEEPYRNPDALRGLEGFSHIWLIWAFHQSQRAEWSPTVRPPRLGGNRRVGVFASRSPFRPNPIGLSSVRLDRIEYTDDLGPVLRVRGADLVDGTPILDIKPYLPYGDSHPEAAGGFASEPARPTLEVEIPPVLLERLPPAADNVVFSVIAEDVFLRVRFMLVFCQTGGKRAMRGFHGRVAMIHANRNGFCHRSSTFSFRLFISFCGARSSGSSFPKPSLRSVFSYSFFSNARYSGDV